MHSCPHGDCPARFVERADMALHFLDHHSPGAQADKKQHEQRIRSALDDHGIQYTHQFRVLNRTDAGDGVADKHFGGDLFVDFLIVTESGDVVVLEVDQMQHKSYGVKNECQRVKSVTALLRQNNVCEQGSAIIWLRYNPDGYGEGAQRYAAVDAVHEAEPCLVRYISSLQDGVVDVEGGAGARESGMTELVFLRYDKDHATDSEPSIAKHIDFFPELLPLVRTLDLSECAVAIQPEVAVKQEPLEEAEEEKDVDEGEAEGAKEWAHTEKRRKVGDGAGQEKEEEGRELVPMSENDGVVAFGGKVDTEMLAECIDAIMEETNENLMFRTLEIREAPVACVTLDSLPRVFDLKGVYSTRRIRNEYRAYASANALPSYVLLHADPITKNGHKNTAFAPAEHVLGFLRGRRSLTAAALVKRIDDEITRQTQAIQLQNAQQRVTAEQDARIEAESPSKLKRNCTR